VPVGKLWEKRWKKLNLFFASLKSMKKRVRSGVGSGARTGSWSISERLGSGDPDSHQNVTDPQHCSKHYFTGPMNAPLQQITLSWDGIFKLLKGQCHGIFDFRFISCISFPQATEYTIRAASNFSKIFWDIRSSKCTNGVVEPVANGKNLQSEKFE
jgi:hypothetical protein